MRTPNDVKLANEVEEIDLILGGHDHHYLIQLINNNKWIIKSGTDFRNLTLIELNQNLKVNKIEKFTIDSNINEDKEIAELVQNYLILEDKESDLDILAKVLVDLDSRFTIVRLQESNIANLICDILLEFLPSADCCIVNSGTFR
jgi:5'-nucleotidase